MQKITRFLVHAADIAGPYRDRQQHDVHRCKARHPKAAQQLLRFPCFCVLGDVPAKGMGRVAKIFQALDNGSRIRLIATPFDGQATVRIVHPSFCDAWCSAERTLDITNALSTGHPLNNEIQARYSIWEYPHKWAEVDGF